MRLLMFAGAGGNNYSYATAPFISSLKINWPFLAVQKDTKVQASQVSPHLYNARYLGNALWAVKNLDRCQDT